MILVEGQTEERFVKDILNPYFRDRDISLTVTILTTKYVKAGPNFKGGITSYDIVKKHIVRLLGDTSANLITTMFDYYGLTKDFPGFDSKVGNCYDCVSHIEDKFKNDIGHKKFLPYFQLHEFEALLFSSPQEIVDTLPSESDDLIKLKKIREAFKNPEEINNSPETCPHKRLERLFPDYNKVIYGSAISSRIGIDIIRKECPHFNSWIEQIESI